MDRCLCGHYRDQHEYALELGCVGRCTARPHDVPMCTCLCFRLRADLQDASSDCVDDGLGYHVAKIPQGVFGEVSKIEEELAEFKDALDQHCTVMALLELADLIGAIEGWLVQYHPSIELEDLLAMSAITKRAFIGRHRIPKGG